MNFKDKTVLIIGGSRGIGAEIVTQFHELGATIIATTTSPENNKEDRKNIFFSNLDFLDSYSIQGFFNEIEEVEYDVLVNSAGIFYSEQIGEINLQRWDDVMKVNLYGPMIVTNMVVKGMMKRKKGKIVNISSIAASVSRPGHATYSASKAGLNGFTRACALDLAPYNVLVNAVCPGTTNTEMTEKNLSKKLKKEIIQKIPLKRLGEPSEVAKLVLFLCSELNTNITGQTINVDGGFTAQ